MSEPPAGDQISRDSKPFSCLICRQRKVKCDRKSPCNNCIKAEKQCSFVAPVRGKRKRTKPPREGLHQKLRRYEELLRAYGAQVGASEYLDDDADMVDASEPDSASQTDAGTNQATDAPSSRCNRPRVSPSPKATESTIMLNNGASRYFDSAPWSNVGPSFHPEAAGLGAPTEDLNLDESGMFFEPADNTAIHDLTSVYPPLPLLLRIKDLYLDRYDPMVKVFHIPSLWKSIHGNLSQHQRLPKEEESVMFAMCLAAVHTLKDDECQNILKASKSALYSRYRVATRQALVNAAFLSTSSPMTLGAYLLFLTCVKESYKVDTIFVLSGIAIRIARRMGLHRDGQALGLSPFETEMRRRLWWHLLQVDFRIAMDLGTRPSLDACTADTKLPLNVPDDDLHPDMTELPEERIGITSISFCLVRCQNLEVLRRFTPNDPSNLRWEALSTGDISLAKKDAIIKEHQDNMESQFLRYCDPSESLDAFVQVTVRSSINKMKLFAHDPRQFANSHGGEIPQSERDLIFSNAMKQLEYITLTRGGHQGLEKYMWHLGTNFLWNAILYALIEARHRKTGSEVDKVWELIGRVFSYYPPMFEESAGPVYVALGRWTLDVWDEYVAASEAEGLPAPSVPEYITAIRRCRRPATDTGPNVLTEDVRPGTALGENGLMVGETDVPIPDFNGLDPSITFPDLLSFETDPNEWEQWEQLLADESGMHRGMIF